MKKPLIFLALLPSLLFAAVWDGTANTAWYDTTTIWYPTPDTNGQYCYYEPGNCHPMPTNDNCKSGTLVNDCGNNKNEYIITTAEQLAGLAQLVNSGTSMSGKTIKLGNDIALNDTTNWRNWATANSGLRQWTNSINDFKGTFDGDGYTVSGLYINTGYNYPPNSLFGYNRGTIKNLGVIASYIKADYLVGGLVSYNSGTINNSYATGNVSGNNNVGGLVGNNDGTINNSYATGNVSGTSQVGGLVGGSSGNAAVYNSYYDSRTSGQNDTGKGIPKTTEYMQSEEFVETLQLVARILSYNAWIYSKGKYPKLSNAIAESIDYLRGNGTEENPYIIETKEQLDTFSLFVNIGISYDGKYLKLGNDIALNDTTNWQDWNEETKGLTQWTAIGGGSPFLGTFDGDGHVISGIYINSESDNQGLFGNNNGWGDNSGTIRNLGVVASYIKGGRNVGSLVGNSGIIINSYATGNVKGNGVVGGLAGSPRTITNSYATGNVSGGGSVGGLAGSGIIRNSYATGKVSGTDQVGGLVGSPSTITNSYATGDVSGTSQVGGLAGRGGVITNSYSIGNVSGTENVGGLVGSGGTITSSYYNKEKSGQSDAGKGEGKTTAQMKIKSNYNGWDFYDIWDIDGISNNGMPYFQWQNTMRQVQVEPIEPKLYTGSQIKPTPKVTSPDGKTELIAGIDFDYYYGANINVADGGTVYIIDKTGTYYGAKILEFVINPSKTVDVYWTPKCGETYEYNGEPQGPTPYTADVAKYKVTASKETNAGIGIVAVAKLETEETDVVLLNDVCPYTIAPKELKVSWTPDSVFTYNKMTQAPMPSVSDANIKLLRHNAHAAAGTYKNEDAASAEIEDQVQARNYTLTNRTKNYEIQKKDLKPYFIAILPPSDFNPSTDTLWVPHEVFNDSAALHSALNTLIDYDGFATDTTKAIPESDNASVLKGSPKVTLQYTRTSPSILSKRVETTQKATATIVTDDISADNYTLTRPAIVIMATIEEDENTNKIFCHIGNSCVQFSEAVCLAVSGQIVETCEIKVACVINGVCVPNTLLETCSLVGEAFSSCDEAPVQRPRLSGGSFRVWQTASGMLNVDLGYMPTAPMSLKVYDLKGNLVATEQVNTRFANVKIGVPSGVYLFRVGSRILRAAVL